MLFAACQFNSPDIINTILGIKGCDINNAGYEFDSTPLCMACQSQAIDVIQILLQNQNIDVNGTERQYTPLHIACKKGNSSIVQLLLSHPEIDVNVTTIQY